MQRDRIQAKGVIAIKGGSMEEKVKKYERKLRWKLFIVLAVFALVVNVMVYFIVKVNLEKHYIDLAQKHMNHQVLNRQQHMAVMGEQFKVLAGDSQFILGIANDNTDIVKSKLEEFFKSSPGLKSASVYNCRNGRQECKSGNKSSFYTDQEIENLLEKYGDDIREAFWFVEGEAGAREQYLNCWVPVEFEGRRLGYLIVRTDLDRFMKEFTGGNSYSFWEEHTAIQSTEALWTDDDAYWEETEITWSDKAGDFHITDNQIVSVTEITSVGEQLIQVVHWNRNEMYRMVALGLAALFFVSLAGCYFIIYLFVRNITVPMLKLKEKMEIYRVVKK